MKKIFLLLLLIPMTLFDSCTVALNGASIPAEMKTVNVQLFENNAPLVIPTLSQDFTEALKTRIRSQTRLSITQNAGDAIFEGRITGYDIKPIAVSGSTNDPTAGGTRLTIRVSVKYTSNLDPKQSFEESFERFKDFKLASSIQTVQDAYIKEINTQLIEDIFNRAFAQW